MRDLTIVELKLVGAGLDSDDRALLGSGAGGVTGALGGQVAGQHIGGWVGGAVGAGMVGLSAQWAV
jgi:hypothetical protein